MNKIKTFVNLIIENLKFAIAHIKANRSDIFEGLIAIIIFAIFAIPLLIIFSFKIIKTLIKIYKTKKELRFHMAATLSAHEMWDKYQLR